MAETADRVRVSIIDDHPVVIEGIRAWLSVEPRVEVSHVGVAVPPFMSDVDVVILDLHLDGRLVIDDIAALAGEGQRVIVFLSSPSKGWCWLLWTRAPTPTWPRARARITC